MNPILEKLTKDMRVESLGENYYRVWCKAGWQSNMLVRQIADELPISAGKEGYEFLRGLGLVQHVYALRLEDGTRLRIIGGPFPPRGQFSNLSELEREVTL